MLLFFFRIVMIKLQYVCVCLVIVTSLVLKSTMAIPVPPTFIEKIKQQILTAIKKDPGTPIMPQHDLKHEKCIAKKFNQTITHDNCIPKVIENRFCYGQCNSFYIPHVTEKPMEICFTCQPDETFEDEIVLDCVRDNQLYKYSMTVQRIQSCRCNQCV